LRSTGTSERIVADPTRVAAKAWRIGARNESLDPHRPSGNGLAAKAASRSVGIAAHDRTFSPRSGLSRVPEVKDGGVVERSTLDRRGVLGASLVVPREGPEHDVALWVDAQEISPRLPIAVPQFRSRRGPSDRAPQHPSSREPPWVVEPDHRVCCRPNDGTGDGSVVPVGDPSGHCAALGHHCSEVVVGERRPVGLVEDRVQLDVVETRTISERAGKGRLARSRAPDDTDPIHHLIVAVSGPAVPQAPSTIPAARPALSGRHQREESP